MIEVRFLAESLLFENIIYFGGHTGKNNITIQPMKKLLFALPLFFLMTFISSCEKTDTGGGAECNNQKLDGKETEIDCGGDCSACPDPAYFSTLVGGAKKHGEVNYTLDTPLSYKVVDKSNPIMKDMSDITISDEAFFTIT